MNSIVYCILFLFTWQRNSVADPATKSITIDFYEHKDFKGEKFSVNLEAKHCYTFIDFNDKASSINTNGACIYVYENAYCSGEWDQISPESNAHNDLKDINFNDRISSIQFCSNQDGDIPVPDQWKPNFRFDRAAECYPADPKTNGECSKLDLKAPVYYEGRQCADDKYRLQYWLFYGWQKGCVKFEPGMGSAGGKHDNDWEHVTLNFKRCDDAWCITSITFSQHGGWYTRKYKGKSSLTVFVGKIAHGNYHNSCCASGCGSFCTTTVGVQCSYFEDFRNPGKYWYPKNLQPIESAFSSNEIIQSHGERDSCSQGKCKKNGCDRNECDLW